ncbi:hypothetical protein SELMODRAFT_426717 [Selaginella moellendorffii]|uniref:Fanconi-associated nuclease n=1 Tax=Selaginella moellendorffii TaxID=88036 RepID=D8SX96_SELML|nr:hypothetical protein SELMODRAFT_426717 [Selaginella moellendorffii]
MLRGRESLIRLVGKRQRNVSLPAREELECGDVSLEIKGGLSLACCDWVECPVCGKQIRGNELLVNCHLGLDFALFWFKHADRWFLLFRYLPAKWEEKEEQCPAYTLSLQLVKKDRKSPPLKAGSPKPEVSSTLESFEEPDVANSVLPAELNSETRDLYNGCLEARIAGRKYHRDVECQAGMRVHLVREPENPMDTYAVKVLTADGLSLGHIPKELSRYLSPLMDKGVVDVQGYVSESTSEAARLKLDLREIQSRTIGSLSEEKVLAVKWSRLMDAADKDKTTAVDTNRIFSTCSKWYWNGISISLLQTRSNFSRHFVQSRLMDSTFLETVVLQGHGSVFRTSSMKILVTQILQSMKRHYLVFDADVNSSELLEHLTVQELKDLAVNSKIMIKSAPLSLKIRFSNLPEHFCSQVIIGFLYKREILGGSNLTALIREATGPCIRIAETVEVLLWRLQRLFFLNGEQEFHVFLVDIGRIKYPSYRCARTMPVFASREDFLAYEQHPFLARFSAAWVYATICTVAASFLEKERSSLACSIVLDGEDTGLSGYLLTWSTYSV